MAVPVELTAEMRSERRFILSCVGHHHIALNMLSAVSNAPDRTRIMAVISMVNGLVLYSQIDVFMFIMEFELNGTQLVHVTETRRFSDDHQSHRCLSC